MKPSDWEGWVEDGLPIQTLPSGEILIFEDPVDLWRDEQERREKYLKKLKRDPPKWMLEDQWYYLPYELPPRSMFNFGPIDGKLQEIASWLFPQLVDEEKDERHRCERAVRRLENRASHGQIWVRRNSNSDWEVWFQDEREYLNANKNRSTEKE